MIIEIGSDIIDIRRIDNTIEKYGFKFKKKCFTKTEIEKSESRKNTSASYAKRYAAKEACAKALGTGLAKGVFWKDIEIYNVNRSQTVSSNPFPQPEFTLISI